MPTPPSFAARRKALLARLVAEDATLVLFAATATLRNNDVHHPFRQESDFFYLTGFEEPDAVLVLNAKAGPESVLFVNPRDEARETWDGPRLGASAVQGLGIAQGYSTQVLAQQLPRLLLGRRAVCCRFLPGGTEPALTSALAVARRDRSGVSHPVRLIDVEAMLHDARRLKSASEIDALERAAAISAEAHRFAMREARPGLFEYELAAKMDQVCRAAGAARVAYEPIVGSGSNATILHYILNRRRMEAGELVLIDAGCEYEYYAADITRTFPVDGRFREDQRQVYECVLNAQHAALAEVRPGATLEGIHRAAARELCVGLSRLGVLEAPPDEALDSEAYKPFYMHKTSHYLGMDVHDVGPYHDAGAPLPLEPGVVLTVEPGLYFRPSVEGPAARFGGIGVRIEDDVVVTEGGYRNLTEGVPKEISAVEALCAGA